MLLTPLLVAAVFTVLVAITSPFVKDALGTILAPELSESGCSKLIFGLHKLCAIMIGSCDVAFELLRLVLLAVGRVLVGATRTVGYRQQMIIDRQRCEFN